MINVACYCYHSIRFDELKDRVIDASKPSDWNQDFHFINQIGIYNDPRALLCHYKSSTIIVADDDRRVSRIFVIAQKEVQENIKRGLENKLGIRLL